MTLTTEHLLLGSIGVEDKLFIGDEVTFDEDITVSNPVIVGDLKDFHKTELSHLTAYGVDMFNIYRWDTRYGFSVYITDVSVIKTINHNLENKDILALHDFLYTLLLNHIGTMDFIRVLDSFIEISLRESYNKGLSDKQSEIQKALGIQGG